MAAGVVALLPMPGRQRARMEIPWLGVRSILRVMRNPVEERKRANRSRPCFTLGRLILVPDFSNLRVILRDSEKESLVDLQTHSEDNLGGT